MKSDKTGSLKSVPRISLATPYFHNPMLDLAETFQISQQLTPKAPVILSTTNTLIKKPANGLV